MEDYCGQKIDVADTQILPEIDHTYDIDRIIACSESFREALSRQGLTVRRLVSNFGNKGLVSGLVSFNPTEQGYATWRLYRLSDMARALKTDKVVITAPQPHALFPATGDQYLIETVLTSLLHYDPQLTVIISFQDDLSPCASASNRVRAWSITSRTCPLGNDEIMEE